MEGHGKRHQNGIRNCVHFCLLKDVIYLLTWRLSPACSYAAACSCTPWPLGWRCPVSCGRWTPFLIPCTASSSSGSPPSWPSRSWGRGSALRCLPLPPPTSLGWRAAPEPSRSLLGECGRRLKCRTSRAGRGGGRGWRNLQQTSHTYRQCRAGWQAIRHIWRAVRRLKIWFA